MSAVIKHTEERLMKVLLAPVISEKATFVAEKNEQVVFLVTPDATKPEIKAAVEMLFKVEQARSSAPGVSSVAVTTPAARLSR
jgi:large subunit ribosomal protein L23